MRPPPPPLDDNHVRPLKKRVQEACLSVTTTTDKRRQEQITRGKNSPARRIGEPIVPPLKVSSDIIVTNLLGMLPSTNLGDYLPEDAHFDTMEVDEHKYRYGKPLVRLGHPPLTTMIQRFHQWYMDTCKSGLDNLMLSVKEEHDL